MDNFIIYLVDDCPYCDKLVTFLEESNLSYTGIPIEKGSETLAQIKKAYDWHTVPMIFKKKPEGFVLLGGYDDLKKLLDKGWPK
jgi:glutaredoxin